MVSVEREVAARYSIARQAQGFIIQSVEVLYSFGKLAVINPARGQAGSTGSFLPLTTDSRTGFHFISVPLCGTVDIHGRCIVIPFCLYGTCSTTFIVHVWTGIGTGALATTGVGALLTLLGCHGYGTGNRVLGWAGRMSWPAYVRGPLDTGNAQVADGRRGELVVSTVYTWRALARWHRVNAESRVLLGECADELVKGIWRG